MEQKLNSQNEEVSFFKGFKSKSNSQITWEEVYRLIRGTLLKNDTEKYRYFKTNGFGEEADNIKKKSPSITPAVVCAGNRTKKNIAHYTHYSLADFDKLAPAELPRCMELLAADPCVFLAYITLSRAGIRVIFRTDDDGTHYNEAFKQGNIYFSRLLGHPYDIQCSDEVRLSALCHDENAIYRPDAQTIHIEIPNSTEKEKTESLVKTEGSQKASRPKKRHHACADEVEENILAELEHQGKTYVIGQRNDYISSALYRMNRLGVRQEEALEWALERFSDYGTAETEAIARSVYQKTEEHGTQKIKQSRFRYAAVHEVETFLTSQADVRQNVITNCREIRMTGEPQFRDITDRDENTLWARANKQGVNTSPQSIQMILNSEFVPPFNPFTTYFESLPAWDGQTDHIARLAASVRTTTPEMFSPCFKKWLVGVVASILSPKVVNHEILVFIGEQGYFKTTWFNRLLSPELERYFYTKTNSARMTKDDQFTLAEFGLICFEEIDSMRPAELNQLKAMITMPTVNERAAYARNKSHRPHIASFCGTGNNLHFLSDPTGNRRWLPFEIEDIDDPYTHPVNYTGVYSQALALYRSGFRYWFTHKEIIRLNRHNERFEVPNLEEELILTHYRKPKRGEQGIFVSTADILQRINALIKIPLSPTKIGIIMRKLQFEPVRNNKGSRGFRAIEFSLEEIAQNKAFTEKTEEKKLPF